jgi:peptidoglycan-associated lipoprotein
MQFRSGFISLPFILLAGCASQQALDPQAADITRQLDEIRQTQAGLSATQQKLDSRVAGVESGQAALKSRLDQALPNAQAMQKELGDIRTQVSDLSAQSAATSAIAAKAQETAEDAIKIARDSRSVAGKVVDSLTLTEDMVSYSYEQPELTASGKAAMDQLIARTKPLMPHAFIEIIGFTDDVGLGSQNRKTALERAESVRRYLRETGGFPLHRMSSISYGDLNPLSSNDSIQGRSQNRRVVVQVLK